MCYIYDEDVKADVRRFIKKYAERRKTFTGLLISQELRKLPSEVGVEPSSHWQVSAYVRELFNGKHEVFEGYGCYPLPGNNSPLMFFPIPGFVKKHAKTIKEKIEAANHEAA